MPFELKVTYEVPEGQEFVSLVSWVKTLHPREQKVYAEAKARNDALRPEQIDLGYIREHDKIQKRVVWEDHAQKSEVSNTDPIWLEYYQRWLAETNTVEVITKIEV